MEQIDDDVAKHGLAFVKCSEEGAAEQFGVARLPSLVFFKNDLPSLYEGMHCNVTRVFLEIVEIFFSKNVEKYCWNDQN